MQPGTVGVKSARVVDRQRGVQKVHMRIREWVRVLRRLLVLAAAISYIYSSAAAAYYSMIVLRGYIDDAPTLDLAYISTLMPDYIGTTTLRASPLVVQTLHNDTTPRTDSLYIQSLTKTSFDDCGHEFLGFNPWTYNNSYMRQNLADLVADTSYNLTFLNDSELILPIVDCTSGAILYADASAARVFYLMRKNNDHDDLYLLTWSLSTQDYILHDEFQVGATASSTLTFINDVRATSVQYYHVMRLGFPFLRTQYQPYTFIRRTPESFWELTSIPRDRHTEASRRLRTACRTGFFVNSETEQSSAKNLNWDLHQDPIDAIKFWSWTGYSTTRDSWGWVHGIHFFFAFSSIFDLVVLMIVVYRSAMRGKVWIGDAFVSVSNSLSIRAALVLFTWYVNGFWTLMEFCLKESNEIADVHKIFAFPMIIHADLLTLYLGLAGFAGYVFRERIDPPLAVFLFQIGFSSRRMIATWFPKTLEVATAFVEADFSAALVPIDPKYEALTPMRLWTVHGLARKDPAFICATLFPTFASFALVILYVPIRKIYHHFFPTIKVMLSHATGASTESETLLAWKSSLTIFEVATGAPLQHRVGLVSDYDNCIYIKGMKFASADGIYCNGYVIASGKWLISTDDLLSILLMILTRVRFKNVYVYEVNGYTVQQTARLVYPEMMTLKDLMSLNISILS